MSDDNTGFSFWITVDRSYFQNELDITKVVDKKTVPTGRLVFNPQREPGAQLNEADDTERLTVKVSGSPNAGSQNDFKTEMLIYPKKHKENVKKSRVKDEEVNLTISKHEKKVSFDDQVTEMM